jgi:transposase InsO family protein
LTEEEQRREEYEADQFYQEWKDLGGDRRMTAVLRWDLAHKMPRARLMRILESKKRQERSRIIARERSAVRGGQPFGLIPSEMEVRELIDGFYDGMPWADLQAISRRTVEWVKDVLRGRGIDIRNRRKPSIDAFQEEHLQDLLAGVRMGYKAAARSMKRECQKERGRPQAPSQGAVYIWMKEHGKIRPRAKRPTAPTPTLRYEAKWAGELWHADTKINVTMQQGSRHWVGIIDDKSRYLVWLEVVETKHAALAAVALRNAVRRARELGFGPPNRINVDNGTEFKGEFKEVAEQEGIRIVLSSPHHPQTNGKIETWWGKFLDLIPEDIELTNEDVWRYIEVYNMRKVNTALDHFNRGGLVPGDVFLNKGQRWEEHRVELGCSQWYELIKTRR